MSSTHQTLARPVFFVFFARGPKSSVHYGWLVSTDHMVTEGGNTRIPSPTLSQFGLICTSCQSSRPSIISLPLATVLFLHVCFSSYTFLHLVVSESSAHLLSQHSSMRYLSYSSVQAGCFLQKAIIS